ncbi:Hypp3519 [Branchiostoma lanceolatum]|uniref:Hypp3519 protein n=1 Tax=Branchiostoma lanceolatum TaxID=7740 RepID=A0A8J9ZZX8_BRALA|nr:Hypp3519 [Branchiostoma lanceolatum]
MAAVHLLAHVEPPSPRRFVAFAIFTGFQRLWESPCYRNWFRRDVGISPIIPGLQEFPVDLGELRDTLVVNVLQQEQNNLRVAVGVMVEEFKGMKDIPDSIAGSVGAKRRASSAPSEAETGRSKRPRLGVSSGDETSSSAAKFGSLGSDDAYIDLDGSRMPSPPPPPPIIPNGGRNESLRANTANTQQPHVPERNMDQPVNEQDRERMFSELDTSTLNVIRMMDAESPETPPERHGEARPPLVTWNGRMAQPLSLRDPGPPPIEGYAPSLNLAVHTGGKFLFLKVVQVVVAVKGDPVADSRLAAEVCPSMCPAAAWALAVPVVVAVQVDSVADSCLAAEEVADSRRAAGEVVTAVEVPEEGGEGGVHVHVARLPGRNRSSIPNVYIYTRNNSVFP